MLSLIMLAFTGCGRANVSSVDNSETGVSASAANRQTPSNGKGEVAPSFAEPYAPLDRVPVTHSERGMPAGCGPQQVVGLMTHFVVAFNEGDEARLERLFPSKATLMPWLYSMNRGGKAEVSTDNSRDLIGYFAERYRRHDQLELVSIEIRHSGATTDETAYADVTYSMNRRADDLRTVSGAWRRTIGKSVMDCRRQVLAVSSLETRS